MNKFTLIFIFLGTWQINFAQSENLEIEGGINISNSNSDTPPEGTIRWTGQDFEGFDGTNWKSLTSGSFIDSEPSLICPTLLEDCILTANWTHANPESTSVTYDLRVDGVDPSQSVDYPATSNTADICDNLGITSGAGTLELELLYWYDDIIENTRSAGFCTVPYDLDTDTGSSRYTFGTPVAGSQQGLQNRRLGAANNTSATRIQVPDTYGGCIQSIKIWTRTEIPGYGSGTRGTAQLSLNEYGTVPGAPLGNTPVSQNLKSLIDAGQGSGGPNNPRDWTVFVNYDINGACFDDGDCFWLTIANTDPNPNSNNFSINGFNIRSHANGPEAKPTDSCFKYLESDMGQNWSELTGNYEEHIYFRVTNTDGRKWGNAYSAADVNVWRGNNDTSNPENTLGDWYINGQNSWRMTYNSEFDITSNASFNFYATQIGNGTSDLKVKVDGVTYNVPASAIPQASRPGTPGYYDGDNWTWYRINLPPSQAVLKGSHVVEFSTTNGTNYLIGTIGIQPNERQAAPGGIQGSAEIKIGSNNWKLMDLWVAGAGNQFNQLQGYFIGDRS